MDRLAESDPHGELPPLPDNFEPAPDEPDFIRRCRERTHYGGENTWTKSWDQNHWRRYLREYGALTQRVDGEVGRGLQALADAGLERDTIVLYTSDHGCSTWRRIRVRHGTCPGNPTARRSWRSTAAGWRSGSRRYRIPSR